MANLTDLIDKRIRRALGGLRLAYRGVLKRVNTEGGVQMTQVSALASETHPEVEFFQHYGLTSVPPDGAMAIMLPVGGATSHSIVIATEHSRYRLQGLEGGEVALYTDEGASIILKHNKVIAVECDDYQVKCKRYRVEAEENAAFDTPELTATQQVIAEGKISGNGGMAIKGGKGATASFEGNVEPTGGTISSPDVEINGVKQGTHKHTTPSGLSDGPISG